MKLMKHEKIGIDLTQKIQNIYYIRNLFEKKM